MGVDYFNCAICNEIACDVSSRRCSCGSEIGSCCTKEIEKEYGLKHYDDLCKKINCKKKYDEFDWNNDYNTFRELLPKCKNGQIWMCKKCDPKIIEENKKKKQLSNEIAKVNRKAKDLKIRLETQEKIYDKIVNHISYNVNNEYFTLSIELLNKLKDGTLINQD